MLRGALLAILVGAVIGTFAVSTDTFGAGGLFERAVEARPFIAGPVPDRPTDGTILVTAPPSTPDSTPPTSSRVPRASARRPADGDAHADPARVAVVDFAIAPSRVRPELGRRGAPQVSDNAGVPGAGRYSDEFSASSGRVREWELP
jgi:hypothetical protein